MVSSGYRRPDGDFDGLVFGDVAESFASAGAAAAAASAAGWRVFHRSAAQQPLDLCAPIETREKRRHEMIDDVLTQVQYTCALDDWLNQEEKIKVLCTVSIIKSD